MNRMRDTNDHRARQKSIMATEIKIPELGESVSEATIAAFLKSPGDTVEADETIVELETDKVTMEVNAPAAGTLGEFSVEEGDTVEVGDVIGEIKEGGEASQSDKSSQNKSKEKEESKNDDVSKTSANKNSKDANARDNAEGSENASANVSPAAKKQAADRGVNLDDVEGTGKDGRVTKGDVLSFSARGSQDSRANSDSRAKTPQISIDLSEAQNQGSKKSQKDEKPNEKPDEERVKMTRLRQTIAKRLKEAQNTAAMLTTFNEVDMTNVMAARKQYQDQFVKKHDVKLGFMSFFVKASIAALKEIPAVNAEIDGDELVYKNHYDIGIAVSTPSGLVVPVVRDADALGFADVEKTISKLGKKGRDGKLAMSDLSGGTFTITNGGIFGSLMSTPILNAPQSGILGMHKIQERPMVVDGKIEVRPMMYLALSYDHRIIDGREAVTFLVRVKECIENPERILFEI